MSERTKNFRDALGLVTYPLEVVFTGRSNRLLEETAGYLIAIADDLNEKDIPLKVVYLPAKVQIGAKHAPSDFDLNLPNRLLAASVRNLVFIDLTESFHGVNVDDAWFREGHYNEQGHEIVAGWLARMLPIDNRQRPVHSDSPSVPVYAESTVDFKAGLSDNITP